ncbi:Sporulation related domain-containing protein [Pelagirhabdus alkalitolerans]|uniref:Sporulation related domain-containing protein n=1 Tax=Pelagirhabdus alkalitolerans TaxID=1612202 RepID=A0A1G6HNW3_9BACI|nr:SPOR domain-containing protein [Pelagirhabdus alkalitolerans]SDB95874.1 Sporulation related domain-containing protein [Pelagirhabdus alkalitolerans]
MERKYTITYHVGPDQTLNESTQNFEAASLEESKSTHMLSRSIAKRIIVVISMSIVIGLAFGFLTMFIFLNREIEDPLAFESDATANQPKPDEQMEEMPLPKLTAYVIQLGLFETEESASEGVSDWQTKGYHPLKWETDEGFRLFLSAYSSKEEAKNAQEALIDFDSSTYVRNWESSSGLKQLSSQDEEWITSFLDQWPFQHSLSDLPDSNLFQPTHQFEDEKLQRFYDQVLSILSEYDDEGIIRLNIMHAYHQFLLDDSL